MTIYVGEPPKSQEPKKEEKPNTGFRKWWLDNRAMIIEKTFPRPNGQPPFKVIARWLDRGDRPHETGKDDCPMCRRDESACLTCEQLILRLETRDVKHDYYPYTLMYRDVKPFPNDAAALHSEMISLADEYVKTLEKYLKKYEEEQERKRALHRSAEQEEEEIRHYAELGKWKLLEKKKKVK